MRIIPEESAAYLSAKGLASVACLALFPSRMRWQQSSSISCSFVSAEILDMARQRIKGNYWWRASNVHCRETLQGGTDIVKVETELHRADSARAYIRLRPPSLRSWATTPTDADILNRIRLDSHARGTSTRRTYATTLKRARARRLRTSRSRAMPPSLTTFVCMVRFRVPLNMT